MKVIAKIHVKEIILETFLYTYLTGYLGMLQNICIEDCFHMLLLGTKL